ncbi:ABC transporter ATP-binding protein [Dactylosporangium sp. NPDC000521]|uniref:ABC transporter ATP-binding protein n=1 Tax=Dactylosporangium sp. NPDC000521 TaxID=3363975 RepID=UPI0036C4B2C2
MTVVTPATTAVPVRLRGVGKSWAGHVVLRDVDLDLEAGRVVALLGASGSGKSTLLRLVAGLDAPTAGTVTVDGRQVRGIEARCAVMFQEPRLLPWRTLAGNVAYGLPRGTGRRGPGSPAKPPHGTVARREAAAEVAALLEVVGLADFARHRPRQVSGGMAQRTALARALARHPGVLLLDEPFAALDALTRLRMQDLVDSVQRRVGTTVLLVTHDVDEALRLADHVVLLGAEPGRPGATAVHTVDVPGTRPRDRGDTALAGLRTDLLTRLGVPPNADPLARTADPKKADPLMTEDQR